MRLYSCINAIKDHQSKFREILERYIFAEQLIQYFMVLSSRAWDSWSVQIENMSYFWIEFVDFVNISTNLNHPVFHKYLEYAPRKQLCSIFCLPNQIHLWAVQYHNTQIQWKQKQQPREKKKKLQYKTICSIVRKIVFDYSHSRQTNRPNWTCAPKWNLCQRNNIVRSTNI